MPTIVPEHDKYTVEEIELMASKLREGDESQIPQIIDAHINEANKIAFYFTKLHPMKRDDLLGAAMHGLVVGVERANKGALEDNNISKYLRSVIRSHVRTFLEFDFLIPIPRYKFKQMKQEEDPIELDPTDYNTKTHGVMRHGVLTRVPVMVTTQPTSDEHDENGDSNTMWEIAVDPEHSPNAYKYLYDTMELNDIERFILEQRMKGKNNTEISIFLECSRRWVEVLIERIQEKWYLLGIGMPMINKISGVKVCKGACGLEKSLSDFYRIAPDKYKGTCKACMKAKRE